MWFPPASSQSGSVFDCQVVALPTITLSSDAAVRLVPPLATASVPAEMFAALRPVMLAPSAATVSVEPAPASVSVTPVPAVSTRSLVSVPSVARVTYSAPGEPAPESSPHTHAPPSYLGIWFVAQLFDAQSPKTIVRNVG